MQAKHDTIAVLDYGSQTAQLIARRVRELHVYCELVPWDAPAERLAALAPKGYILSGGPSSVYDPGAPTLAPAVLASGLPVLGICYGMQLLAFNLGGQVDPAARREYGHAEIEIVAPQTPLLAGLPQCMPAWMSHGDHVTELPATFTPLARTASSVAAMGDVQGHIYGVQFHPEVQHTPQGKELLANFVLEICGCRPDWTPANFIEETVADLRARIGEGSVICGLSGGVDSAVAAGLLHRAIGDRLTCIFVDHGLLRQGEAEQVVETFGRHMGMQLVAVDASADFLADLAGVTDPERKRKLIGTRFVRTFEQAEAEAAARSGGNRAAFLAQGTLYPDVIESASRAEQRTAHTIKTHHNVGGLPEEMQFE
ncbi:MAG TPA: glutamine-hydrolyzing GMP synthase, partial [Anaerolineae bacterium]